MNWGHLQHVARNCRTPFVIFVLCTVSTVGRRRRRTRCLCSKAFVLPFSPSLSLFCLCILTGVNACHIPFPAKHSRLRSLLITLTGKHKKMTSVKGAFIQNNTTHPSKRRVPFVFKNSLAMTERCCALLSCSLKART